MLIALLMLALVFTGLVVDEAPAAWVVPLLIFVLVLVADICRLRDEERDFDTEVELEEDDGLRPPPVIVLKKLFKVFT